MIFICGHHNTGKTTIAKELTKRGFFHIETGDIVRGVFKKKRVKSNFYEWAEKRNKNTPHFFNQCILRAILEAKKMSQEDDGSKIIITGNRQLKGIKYLIKNSRKEESIVIYLDSSDNEKLYKRQLKRKDRKIENLNKENFIKEYLDFDKRMGVERIKKEATYIVNSGMSKKTIIKEILSILKNKRSGANVLLK